MAQAQICRIEKSSNYTTMGNFHLRDKKLSLKAKGLLSVVLSLPPNWDYSVAGLVAIVMEKETVVRSCLKELKEAGYLVIEKERPTKENGGHFNYIYIFYEKSQLLDHKIENSICENLDVESLDVENLDIEVLDVENQRQINTNILSKDKLSKEELKVDSKKRKVFKKPSVEEVQAYCEERQNSIDPEEFVDFYESKGWVVGKSPMKDWKAAVRTWEKNSYGRQNSRQVVKGEILYQPKDGEDVAYQRMFDFWKQYVRISVPQTNEQVQACKELLEDVGEEGLQRLIVALAMRSKHSYLPAELTKIKDFIGLRNNAVVVQSFYDQHWQYWQQMQKAAQLGKEIWEV